MIYVTGDLHGDRARLQTRAARMLKKDDTLLVCGDFGFIWDGSKKERRILRWIGRRRYHVLFIEGTHDNLDLLEAYPTEEFCGGLTRRISGRLRYLCRGEVFALEGKRIFALGGGESGDFEHRIPGVSWWERELPDDGELAAARARLAGAGGEVDYILSHECSSSLRKFIDMQSDHITRMGAFFEEIADTCRFKRWFFGYYHQDKRIAQSYVAVYKHIVPLDE